MKHIGHIVGILIVTAFFLLLVYLQREFLDRNLPQLPDGVTPQQWVGSFIGWAHFCVVSAAIASLLWYGLAQWVFKIRKWEDTEKRPWWIALCILPLAAIIASCIFVKRAEDGLRLEQCIFFLINGLFSYYISTVLFSPSSFKYTPVLAKRIRYW